MARLLLPLQQLNAEAAGMIARSLGLNAAVRGTAIFASTRILQVDSACTAVGVAATYGCLVAAYPLARTTRVLALLVGLPAIMLANLVRLVAVVWASEAMPGDGFNFVHDYLFQVAMVGFSVALWVLWLAVHRLGVPSKDLVSFIGLAAVVSLALSWMVWVLALGSEYRSSIMNLLYLVPGVAAILCARGASWTRRLAFVFGTAAVGVLLEAVVASSGVRSLALERVQTLGLATAWLGVLIVLQVLMIAVPVAGAMLFMGRRPSRFWGPAPTPAVHRKSARSRRCRT